MNSSREEEAEEERVMGRASWNSRGEDGLASFGGSPVGEGADAMGWT